MLVKIIQGDYKGCERLQKFIGRKVTHTKIKRTSLLRATQKVVFRTLLKFRMCSICAHIKKAFNVLQFFVFDLSRCCRSQALVEHKPQHAQNSTGRSQWGEIWRSGRPGGDSASIEPSLKQLPVQECYQLTVAIWWRSVVFRQCL